jgi:hypothetical protein
MCLKIIFNSLSLYCDSTTKFHSWNNMTSFQFLKIQFFEIWWWNAQFTFVLLWFHHKISFLKQYDIFSIFKNTIFQNLVMKCTIHFRSIVIPQQNFILETIWHLFNFQKYNFSKFGDEMHNSLSLYCDSTTKFHLGKKTKNLINSTKTTI